MRLKFLVYLIPLLASFLMGCGPGQPWGSLKMELAPGFAFDGRHLGNQNRFVTSSSYQVVLDGFEVEIESVEVMMGSMDTKLKFDPAKPPPGYSLCHQGHCHSDDGRLVDYKDVVLEVSGRTNSSEDSLVLKRDFKLSYRLPLHFEGEEVLGEFIEMKQSNLNKYNQTGRIDLPEGKVVSIGVKVKDITLRGHLYDGTNQSRLPAQGVAIDKHIPVHRLFQGEVKDLSEIKFDASVVFFVKASLFDLFVSKNQQLDLLQESQNIIADSFVVSVQTKKVD